MSVDLYSARRKTVVLYFGVFNLTCIVLNKISWNALIQPSNRRCLYPTPPPRLTRLFTSLCAQQINCVFLWMHLRWRVSTNESIFPRHKKQKKKTLAWVHPLLTRTSPFLVKNDWCAGGSFHFFSGPCKGGGGPVSSGRRGRRHGLNEPTTYAPPTAKSTTEKWGCLLEFLRGIFTNEGWRAHPQEEIHDGRRFLLT